EAVLFMKPHLDGRQVGALRQPFHRSDAPAFCLDRQHRARLDRLGVEEHSACSAARGVAADMRAGEAKVGAQEINQENAGLNVTAAFRAVDLLGDFHDLTSLAMPFVVCMSRCTKTRTTSFL